MQVLISPKSYHKKQRRRPQGKRKHTNTKFYTSKQWRETRAAYINEYQHKIYRELPNGYWTLHGAKLEVLPHQAMFILSRGWLPCEICLKLYLVGAYDTVEQAKELDHIDPVNPENALESEGYGDPFDFANHQYLCRRHHAKKSQRESWQK